MASHETFIIQLDRIKSTFGKAAFGDERMKIIYKFVRDLNEYVLKCS